jgi:signal peptidase I
MTKRKPPSVTPRPVSEGSADRSDPRPDGVSSPDASCDRLHSPVAIREWIEQVILALVGVFLFWTFEAEAFVIPTGSMAPTLMGRHKDLACPKCGFFYQVSSSEEVDQNGVPRVDATGRAIQTVAGTCPMCRYTALLGKDNPQHQSHPSCNGDRIEVSKLAYQLGEPARWDVVVFKYPGDPPSVPPALRTDARTNYIKRLVGLPGETVRVQHGDIWIRRGEEPFRMARKPPEKLLAMLQLVFDNDYMPQIAKHGWPARWSSDQNLRTVGANAGAWTSDDMVAFHTDGAAKDKNWLRYHHVVPSYWQWQRVDAGRPNVAGLDPQLITDFTAYNTVQTHSDRPAPEPQAIGLHWVGDLAIACTLELEGAHGELAFELCKGGRRFQCRFDAATGRATLSISGHDMTQWRPTALSAVRGPGRHDIRFSNCDDELLLWVDGTVVSFDTPTTYGHLNDTRPDDSDLAPVGVAASGAPVRISHLRVFRDIYYGAMCGEASHVENHDLLYPPGQALPNPSSERVPAQPYCDFPLQSDQFFVLGDNSAMSKDGRLWGLDSYWVPRELLIGKALVLSWPRRSCTLPYVNVPIPFFPSFDRMGLIR